MEEFSADVAKWLLGQGWPGVVILGLATVTVVQWREVVGVRKAIFHLQAARVSDAQTIAKEAVAVIAQCRSSMDVLTATVHSNRVSRR